MRPVLAIAVAMIGAVCAFVTVASVFAADIGSTLVFGAIAWACWVGFTKLTAPAFD